MTHAGHLEDTNCSEEVVSLLVPRRLVRTVKNTIETRKGLLKKPKICTTEDGNTYIISTAVLVEQLNGVHEDSGFNPNDVGVLKSLGLANYAADIEVRSNNLNEKAPEGISGAQHRTSDSVTENSIARIVSEWLGSVLDKQLSPQDHDACLRSCTKHAKSYTIYPPLMLLPSSFFHEWPSTLIDTVHSEKGKPFFELLCKAFRTTHVALGGRILPQLPAPEGPGNKEDQHSAEQNILRSPTTFTPLYGEFGPALPLSHRPNQTNFDQAFWCTTKQNGISQTWAPRYTMFSRGNISEKARILQLKTLQSEALGCPPEQTSAIDLYSGIGYFAFSYAKVGVAKVLCWEINPWSIEGLRRGAKENIWDVHSVLKAEPLDVAAAGSSRLLIFEESNENAAERVSALRDSIPPVRHVSCGYLPSSQQSWRTAYRVLDPKQGGWIHAHENVAKGEIDKRGHEIVDIFKEMSGDASDQTQRTRNEVTCEHVQRVKSYAPGVIHCVFDIAIKSMYSC